MKSIFKKIAFVLALAMVVTMMPAKAAAAAESDGPQMYSTLRLYIGGDVTGTYSGERFAKVWNKGDYTVAFESSNESVATVNSKSGRVTAVGVGSATVTATFTAEDGSTVIKTCVVTVKKNAVVAGLSGASTKKVTEEGIKVGETVQLTAVRKDADGNAPWKGRDVITDGVRFASSNTDVFTVQKTTGKITGVAEGEATLYVWAVQSEGKDPVTGEYPATTEKKEYKVIVKADQIQVEQTAYNGFSITFSDEEAAAAAVSATLPSLSKADAAVSEDKSVVKVYEVLKAATDTTAAVEQEVFISNISNSGNVVYVTLFNEMSEEATYTVRYEDYAENFTTCKNVAVDIEPYDYIPDGGRTEYSIEKTIDYRLYATGVNGQKVDITGCKTYGNGDWKNSVTIEDLATDYSANYVFSGNSVWFYTAEAAFTVSLRATFEDWYVVNGSNANVIVKNFYVTPGDTTIVTGSLLEWGIVTLGTGDAYTNKLLAVEDSGYRLAVKASITKYGVDTTVTTSADGYDDKFTFVSSNDDKLSVNKETGEIYPPKSAVDNVLIHVFYDETYVGSCPVSVVAKRVFTKVYTYQSLQKLAYGENLAEETWFGVYTEDQLGAHYDGTPDGYIALNIALADKAYDGMLEISTDWTNFVDLTSEGVDYTVSSADKMDFDLRVTSLAPTTAKTIRLVVTTTYYSNDGKTQIQKKTSLNITVKNTVGADIKSYSLVADPNTVDEALDVPGKRSDTAVASKTTSVQAFALDKEGFKIKQLAIDSIAEKMNSGEALAEGSAVVLIKRGNETQTDAGSGQLGFTLEGSDIVFTTVTGSAVNSNVIVKAATGNYSVNLFVGNEKNVATYKAGSIIVVSDTQDTPTFKWVKNVVADGTDVEIATQALSLYFDYYRAGYTVDVTNGIVAADVVINGNRATIKSVTYRWYLTGDDAGKYLDFVVSVNRTVTIGE